ncbi:MAG: ribosome recycling factor [Candidatus Margulisiibacteriota bacterium]
MDVIKDTEIKMQKAIDALRKHLASVRTGRASPALLDQVHVEYYGSTVPLKQIAQVSTPEARQLLITPFDKSASQSIEKAINASNLGMTPKNEGGVIRLLLPELSEERRKDLVKGIKKEAEDAKVSIRNARREAIDLLKKQKQEKTITEDEEKTKDKKMQELTDKYCADADKLILSKEKEILEV